MLGRGLDIVSGISTYLVLIHREKTLVTNNLGQAL